MESPASLAPESESATERPLPSADTATTERQGSSTAASSSAEAAPSSPSLEPMPSSPASSSQAPTAFSLRDLEASADSSPGFAFATPSRLLKQIGRCADSDSEPDTPKMQDTPASSRMEGDWNKENVPVGGGYQDTPTNSKRGLFSKTHSIKLLSQESSAGCSPAFENLLKRPLATVDENAGGFLKKRKYAVDDNEGKQRLRKTNMLATRTVPAFCRSFSETAATMRQKMQIMNACQRADSMTNLTADFSREMALPTMISGTKHQDLPSIDCHTLADVLKGAYAHKIDCVRIVDARYKYEYDGGHIRGAENWGHWEEEAFWAEFLPPGTGPKRRRNQKPRAEDGGAEDSAHFDEEDVDMPSEGNSSPSAATGGAGTLDASGNEGKEYPNRAKREIIIFHCEFSSARGPALMRDLRSRDREVNKPTYPNLYHPETYLLHEGYKVFWENYPDLCTPRAYQPMKDPKYSAEEKSFRKKSKTWASGAGGTVARTGAAPRMLKM